MEMFGLGSISGRGTKQEVYDRNRPSQLNARSGPSAHSERCKIDIVILPSCFLDIQCDFMDSAFQSSSRQVLRHS